MPSKAETIGQALNGILSIEKFAAKVVPYLFSFQCVPSNAIPAQKWDFAKTFFFPKIQQRRNRRGKVNFLPIIILPTLIIPFTKLHYGTEIYSNLTNF